METIHTSGKGRHHGSPMKGTKKSVYNVRFRNPALNRDMTVSVLAVSEGQASKKALYMFSYRNLNLVKKVERSPFTYKLTY